MAPEVEVNNGLDCLVKHGDDSHQAVNDGEISKENATDTATKVKKYVLPNMIAGISSAEPAIYARSTRNEARQISGGISQIHYGKSGADAGSRRLSRYVGANKPHTHSMDFVADSPVGMRASKPPKRCGPC